MKSPKVLSHHERLATALIPGGIEASEKEGQLQFVDSDVVPADMKEGRAAYEALGFKFGNAVPGDPLFIQASLPPGWKRVATGHSMWSDIVDETGARRIAVFFKAAFYDRHAFMRFAS